MCKFCDKLNDPQNSLWNDELYNTQLQTVSRWSHKSDTSITQYIPPHKTFKWQIWNILLLTEFIRNSSVRPLTTKSPQSTVHIANWWAVYLGFIECSGVPRNFVQGGGSTNSDEDRGQREQGSGGGSPLVRGSGGTCNLVQEISFHMVKFS